MVVVRSVYSLYEKERKRARSLVENRRHHRRLVDDFGNGSPILAIVITTDRASTRIDFAFSSRP